MPVALDLAIADPGAPVFYLSRPCQFMAWQAEACPTRLWAEGRFGGDVIAAMDGAVVAAERRVHATGLVLVGFSGGAAVAALLALRHPETELLVTVAGVVDHAAWTRLHRVAPLEKSLNPADQVEKLARIRQMHLVGTVDRNVPPVLIEGLVARYGDGSAAMIMTTPNGHDCCWSEGWAAWIAAQRAALAS
jgi:pimeloyl-ACP methyl ester carboxylesterase